MCGHFVKRKMGKLTNNVFCPSSPPRLIHLTTKDMVEVAVVQLFYGECREKDNAVGSQKNDGSEWNSKTIKNVLIKDTR
jgi:hypothetical protein